MPEGFVRCFVAAPVGSEVRDELDRWKRMIRHRVPNAKWVNPEHFHLTLKFFGEIDENTVAKLTDSLGKALNNVCPFPIEIVGIGAFPNLSHPRVLWAGVGEGADELRDLAGIVESASLGLDLPADRRDFHPHLTLARFRVRAGKADLDPEIFEVRQRVWGRFHLHHLELLRSELTPQGPIYQTAACFPLKGNRDASGKAVGFPL